MKKPKEKINKTPAPRLSNKSKKVKEGDEVEELFGVHIVSTADIENHFGISDEKAGDEMPKDDAPTGESENKR